MVQLMSSGTHRPEADTMCRGKVKVPMKVKIEDALEDKHSLVNKRSKISPPFQQQWSMGRNTLPILPSQSNSLDEPRPLGLRLKKSQSFLDLIQMKLSQGNVFPTSQDEKLESGKKKYSKGSASSIAGDKLKASNFPASLLKIGTWECVSRYEGDLVAKCYFAKHKLVWEVLNGGLKSKMEIQWSDIMALKASLPENGPGTLDIVLSRQPFFFLETNPQPRKHTLWQATSDFTGGQASLYRRHFLQCPQGLLNRHFEKLIQVDPRLNWLNQQPAIVLESPYFESKGSIFEGPYDSRHHGLDHQKGDHVSTFFAFRDASPPSAVQSSSSKSELWDPVGRAPDNMSQRTPSPSSVTNNFSIEDNIRREAQKVLSHSDQFNIPRLHQSMSMNDLVNHIGSCISGQNTFGNPNLTEKVMGMLEDIAHYLLSDSQLVSSSDEQSLVSRVDSLCYPLQKDGTNVQNFQVNNEVDFNKSDEARFPQEQKIIPETKGSNDFFGSGGERDNGKGDKQAPSISRKDSLGDLLLHLPRIASLPHMLFNVLEENETNATG